MFFGTQKLEQLLATQQKMLTKLQLYVIILLIILVTFLLSYNLLYIISFVTNDFYTLNCHICYN